MSDARADATATPGGWREQARPPGLFRRFDFDGYDGTRDFLDQAAQLSEAEGIFPNISFGRTYANVTVAPIVADAAAIGPTERRFAARLTALADGRRTAEAS
jgi:pterin-4a-carbinolamine dehydratase